ncbi:MAG: protoglobin domain-containing protein [Aquirhabdus sp.]
MNITDRTLLQQMRITESEVESRKALLSFTSNDVNALIKCSPIIHERLDSIVNDFYRQQTSVPEIALLIGDADTLAKLRYAQRRYISDIFSGIYDLEYVNNRLRIGLVHKRIGVEPKLYLSAVHTLKSLLSTRLRVVIQEDSELICALDALEKIMLFDVTFIFETYIRSLVSEIENAKDRSERYAHEMEDKKLELEEISSTDPLTGLLNSRHLNDVATTVVRNAQSRSEPVTFLFIDIDRFKKINDTEGHQHGDEVLRVVGSTIKSIVRDKDHCFRYGGDEFCVIMSNCGEETARNVFVRRLHEQIKEKLGNVTLSIGLAQTGPKSYEDIDTIIHKADENMYEAKLAVKSADQSN